MAQTAKVLSPTRSPLHLFGAEVRRRRLDTGLSQADFGRRLNYSPDLVRRVESGDRLPSYEFVVDCDATLGAGEALVRMWPLLEREHRLRSNSELAYTSNLPDRQVLDWLLAPAALKILGGKDAHMGDAEAELRRLRRLDHAQGAGATYADVAGRIGEGLAPLARMSRALLLNRDRPVCPLRQVTAVDEPGGALRDEPVPPGAYRVLAD